VADVSFVLIKKTTYYFILKKGSSHLFELILQVLQMPYFTIQFHEFTRC
jgi:hypothetical protein